MEQLSPNIPEPAKEVFEADNGAMIVVDDSERRRWSSLGLTDRAAQDAVFRDMARAVASLTTGDDRPWRPASEFIARNDESRPTDT